MSFSFYIYYKVTPRNEASVLNAAHALQTAIAAATGIKGRLLCRRDKPDTWMEVYENVTDDKGFQVLLETEAQRLGFAALLAPDSRRMTELFRPL